MITLYYDNAIFHRSTSTATAFQLGGKAFYFIVIELETRYCGHRLTFAALNFTLNPNYAIYFYIWLRSGFFSFCMCILKSAFDRMDRFCQFLLNRLIGYWSFILSRTLNLSQYSYYFIVFRVGVRSDPFCLIGLVTNRLLYRFTLSLHQSIS